MPLWKNNQFRGTWDTPAALDIKGGLATEKSGAAGCYGVILEGSDHCLSYALVLGQHSVGNKKNNKCFGALALEQRSALGCKE